MHQNFRTHYRVNQQKELVKRRPEIPDETQFADESASEDADENCFPNEISDLNNQSKVDKDHEQDQTPEVNEITKGTISKNNTLDDRQAEEPQPQVRRYLTRGAKANPSWKQAENDSWPGNNSNYGVYPAAYTVCYLARSKVSVDPQTYKEAMTRPEADQWRSAIFKKFSQLQNMKTRNSCKRSSLSPELRPLTGKLVFKTKRDKNGNILKHKARWVVGGFEQKEGVDYNQTFASACC
ncbi:hypothetical protein GcM3_055040 [Golovinomyces cichoracearum]|uniref:Reverse transcriptase Ty1/copia-type domain-containing protein n=1 Tax=Golovinomyces cichoracearum TaxID=62708 RepID=A0A420IY89_9PEZI|nr:hypothetical protein GcM3_055040 [Golovinomyces cichoracearum]